MKGIPRLVVREERGFHRLKEREPRLEGSAGLPGEVGCRGRAGPKAWRAELHFWGEDWGPVKAGTRKSRQRKKMRPVLTLENTKIAEDRK